ncbi:hypothetical protein C0J52_02777 [Blattella germanica]|nr:hypothetical protein C0J52_02777 [Blattella germanica]
MNAITCDVKDKNNHIKYKPYLMNNKNTVHLKIIHEIEVCQATITPIRTIHLKLLLKIHIKQSNFKQFVDYFVPKTLKK